MIQKFFFFLVIFSFTFTKVSAQNGFKNQVDVLSWNIYMLPGIANISKEIERNDKKGRAKEIANYINASTHDIIVFQEAFFNPSRRLLSKLLIEKYPYQYGPANPSKCSLKTSSGIFIVSKQPLNVLGQNIYETCNGADCFAKKGAYLLEGLLDNKPFQILGTHLNAGEPQWIREEQYRRVNELLISFRKLGVPQIVCGDMNTHKENEIDYFKMLKILDVQDLPNLTSQVNTTAKDKSIIDYIFINPNKTSLHSKGKTVLWINPNKYPVIEKLNGNLSDHLAIQATFSW
jgi:endonuclease/exonuclease/phosphatase family metal-dependent hydrolase